ncbi:hypothetical protein ACS0TY_016669 [Phlomoides rotata]
MSGHTLNARRSRLTVEHIENQCLLDDWVKVEDQTQNQCLSTDTSEKSEMNDTTTSESDAYVFTRFKS